MTAQDLMDEWSRDPGFGATFRLLYPYHVDALRLVEHRARRGLTIGAYAARLKVPRSAVEKWESGTHPVPAMAFGVR